jgi:hypothetical protein
MGHGYGETSGGYSYTTLPACIQQLLQQYSPVFQDPKCLPPCRAYDLAISLLPNAISVNSRPCRYSPLKKDEI